MRKHDDWADKAISAMLRRVARAIEFEALLALRLAEDIARRLK